MTQQSQPYTRNEMVRTTFYQLPKVFFTKHSRYENLSLQAAVAFSFLQDRLSYSIKNNWCDENGAIYFIFTNEELCETLKIKSKATVIKIKKELEQFGLLEQKRMGLNQPNRLYLLHPIVTAEDVYEISHETKNHPNFLEPQGSIKNELPKKSHKSLEPQGSIKNELPKKSHKSLEPQGSIKNELPEDKPKSLESRGSIKNELPKKDPKPLESRGSIKNELNQYKDQDNGDTIKILDDTQLDFSTAAYDPETIKQQNADLLNHLPEINQSKTLPPFLNQESAILIKSWCRTPKEVYRFTQIILNAKNSVIKDMSSQGFGDYAGLLDLETLSDEMTNWLRNYFNRIRAVETDPKKRITNYESYLYIAMANNFNAYMHKQLTTPPLETDGISGINEDMPLNL